MQRLSDAIRLSSLVVLIPTVVMGGMLNCPDTLDDAQGIEVMATSAPEVKVRANVQKDVRRWAEVVRPLAKKATSLAQQQRATLIQEGVEAACSRPQQYVGHILPGTEKSTGCDRRIVTRPADPENIWVQVVAICKYDWACCTPEIPAPNVGYKIEGPVGTSTSTSTATIKK